MLKLFMVFKEILEHCAQKSLYEFVQIIFEEAFQN